MSTSKRSNNKSDEALAEEAEFHALVDSLYGSMSHLKGSVDDFLRQKYAETEAENAQLNSSSTRAPLSH